TGCNENTYNENSITEEYLTQEEALNDLSTGIQGSIVLFNTHKGEDLLVVNSSKELFSVYELILKDEKFGIIKLTADYSLKGEDFSNSSWEFTSVENNNYKINISKVPKDNAYQIPEQNYFISIFEKKLDNPSETPTF